MVREAEAEKQSVLDALTEEKSVLSRQIEELRGFERDYRARLKSYIEGQLDELDHTGVDRGPAPHSDAAESASEGATDAAEDAARAEEAEPGPTEVGEADAAGEQPPTDAGEPAEPAGPESEATDGSLEGSADQEGSESQR